MSFLEHLEELRRRLIICAVAVFIATGVGWPLVPTVQKYITRPLQEPSVIQKWSYGLELWLGERFPDLSRRLDLKPDRKSVV